MTMNVIGLGVGRTGTYSLRAAINQLGLGPCYHMEDVLQDLAVRVPLWSAVASGSADWQAIYSGFHSAVDWPTACFYRELLAEYPSAKFVLTVRSPQSWADSFGSTIYELLAGRDQAPPKMHAWLDMASAVITKTGFPPGLDRDGLMKGFVAHNERVKSTIPPGQLLTFEVKDGWGPLCSFLDKPVPTDAFPRTNNRSEFWDLVNANA